MGFSKFTIGPPKEPGEKGYERRKQGRETFGLDVPRDNDHDVRRTLRVRSLDLAKKGVDFVEQIEPSFNNDYFVANPTTNRFHLFLMGCEVGQVHEGKRLTEALKTTMASAAETLAHRESARAKTSVNCFAS
jgi:hypothetical protein